MEAAFTDREDNRTSRGDESRTQLTDNKPFPAIHHTLGLHPNHLEVAGSSLFSLLFNPNVPVIHSPISPATAPENGVIHPVHPFNPYTGQPVPPLPAGSSYVIYPVHPIDPPTPSSYAPPAMAHPTSGLSPDALLTMLRMDPRYASLFSYTPFSQTPVQHQHGFAVQTGTPFTGAPPATQVMLPAGTQPPSWGPK
jgi:hypothetical protein